MAYFAHRIPPRVSAALSEFLDSCDEYQFRHPRKLFEEFLDRIEFLDLPLVAPSEAALEWFRRGIRVVRERRRFYSA